MDHRYTDKFLVYTIFLMLFLEIVYIILKKILTTKKKITVYCFFVRVRICFEEFISQGNLFTLHAHYFNICFLFLFSDFDDCSSNPCLNGGTCTDLYHMFSCTCNSDGDVLPYYAGKTCGKCKIINY